MELGLTMWYCQDGNHTLIVYKREIVSQIELCLGQTVKLEHDLEYQIYHFWWFSDYLGVQDALLNSPSDWLSASFPTEHRLCYIDPCIYHVHMCLFQCVFLKLEEKPCGDSSWYLMQYLTSWYKTISKRYYSDSHVHKEKTSLREDYLVHCLDI